MCFFSTISRVGAGCRGVWLGCRTARRCVRAESRTIRIPRPDPDIEAHTASRRGQANQRAGELGRRELGLGAGRRSRGGRSRLPPAKVSVTGDDSGDAGGVRARPGGFAAGVTRLVVFVQENHTTDNYFRGLAPYGARVASHWPLAPNPPKSDQPHDRRAYFHWLTTGRAVGRQFDTRAVLPYYLYLATTGAFFENHCSH